MQVWSQLFHPIMQQYRYCTIVPCWFKRSECTFAHFIFDWSIIFLTRFQSPPVRSLCAPAQVRLPLAIHQSISQSKSLESGPCIIPARSPFLTECNIHQVASPIPPCCSPALLWSSRVWRFLVHPRSPGSTSSMRTFWLSLSPYCTG
jgi:hypothetical protein